jgi:hypothetical protein
MRQGLPQRLDLRSSRALLFAAFAMAHKATIQIISPYASASNQGLRMAGVPEG